MTKPADRAPAGPEPSVRWIVAANPGYLTLEGTRCYRVGRERVVLVDPGPSVPGQLDELEGLADGRSVEAVCLTHAHLDHAEMAGAVAERLGAPVAASAETLRRCGLDGRSLADGDVVSVDGGNASLTAISTPGHSADHLAFLLDPSRALFTGDLVLGRGSSAVLHPDGEVSACLASLTRLLSLRPGRIYPGHGPPITDGVRRLVEYRQHRLDRHAQVIAAIEAGGRSVAALRQAVYGDVDEALTVAADASIRAHVAYLRASDDSVPPIAGFGEAPVGGEA